MCCFLLLKSFCDATVDVESSRKYFLLFQQRCLFFHVLAYHPDGIEIFFRQRTPLYDSSYLDLFVVRI